MTLVENSAAFDYSPILGEVVKICEIGTVKMIDGSDKPYSERFFVSIKELPSESNNFTYNGIVSNDLIHSKHKIGSSIQFKHINIIELTGRVHSIESTLHTINMLKRNPELLQLFQMMSARTSIKR